MRKVVDKLPGLHGYFVLTGDEDPDGTSAVLFCKTFVGNVAEVVTDLETQALKSSFGVIKSAGAHDDSIDTAIFADTDDVDRIDRTNRRIGAIHLLRPRPR